MDEREKELLDKALAGDGSAFEELVWPYRQSLLHLSFRMTGNREEAMDITQEALLKSFRYLKHFEPEKIFRNWLFQIAANECRDFLKKGRTEKKYRQQIGRRSQVTEFDPEDIKAQAAAGFEPAPALSSELKLDVNKCLQYLSPKEREVFILRDLQGFNIKETASTLGLSAISVRVNLSSARKKIRQAIEGERIKAPGQGGKT